MSTFSPTSTPCATFLDLNNDVLYLICEAISKKQRKEREEGLRTGPQVIHTDSGRKMIYPSRLHLLANLCSTSKRLRAVGEPLLYRTVTTLKYGPPNLDDILRMLVSLKDTKVAHRYVRTFKIAFGGLWSETWGQEATESALRAALVSVMCLMPNLYRFECSISPFSDGAELGEMPSLPNLPSVQVVSLWNKSIGLLDHFPNAKNVFIPHMSNWKIHYPILFQPLVLSATQNLDIDTAWHLPMIMSIRRSLPQLRHLGTIKWFLVKHRKEDVNLFIPELAQFTELETLFVDPKALLQHPKWLDDDETEEKWKEEDETGYLEKLEQSFASSLFHKSKSLMSVWVSHETRIDRVYHNDDPEPVSGPLTPPSNKIWTIERNQFDERFIVTCGSKVTWAQYPGRYSPC